MPKKRVPALPAGTEGANGQPQTRENDGAMSGLTAFELLRIQSDFTISSLLRRLSSSLEVIRRELPDGRRFGG
jgi:hypothetical protein